MKSDPNEYIDIIKEALTLVSQGPLPCFIMHVESRFLREKMSDHKLLIKILTYSNNVLESKTYFLKFNFLIFLSDVGGSMGLWLGIGLLQALGIIAKLSLNSTSTQTKAEVSLNSTFSRHPATHPPPKKVD